MARVREVLLLHKEIFFSNLYRVPNVYYYYYKMIRFLLESGVSRHKAITAIGLQIHSNPYSDLNSVRNCFSFGYG